MKTAIIPAGGKDWNLDRRMISGGRLASLFMNWSVGIRICVLGDLGCD